MQPHVGLRKLRMRWKVARDNYRAARTVAAGHTGRNKRRVKGTATDLSAAG